MLLCWLPHLSQYFDLVSVDMLADISVGRVSVKCQTICRPIYRSMGANNTHDLWEELNPLMPVPPVTARDEPWPFFLFWGHHFWPKLASSILNFCRRKISFQWCPDQSDWPNGALDMHKNAKKVEWKTCSKISCHCTWMLHAKNYLSRWSFFRSFLTASKPSGRSITAAKTREKEKKERWKKIPKIEKPKDVSHFLVSAHALDTMD